MAVLWVVAPCRLQGATTQRTAIFILAAVRTSNLTTENSFIMFIAVKIKMYTTRYSSQFHEILSFNGD
jgi:hypothetical protein